MSARVQQRNGQLHTMVSLKQLLHFKPPEGIPVLTPLLVLTSPLELARRCD